MSCQQIGSTSRQQHGTLSTDSLAITHDEDAAGMATADAGKTKQTSRATFIVGNSCLVGAHRLWESSDDPEILLEGEWLDVFKEGNTIRIVPLQYKVTEGFDECAGVKTKAVATQHKSLILLKLGDIKTGSYPAVEAAEHTFWPNEKREFTFAGQTYSMAGSGNINESYTVSGEDGKEELFHVVSDYSLTMTDPTGRTFTLVSEESFQDTFIKILFVGDLDGDDRPDFLISVPRGYEEERVLWIPSRHMTENGLKVYEATRQFDC
ncbi:hypothetical protein GCM10017764_16730 [Sphingobacterium griseoflavum]|uniref:Uncharacterized protein n=2 Tax=Sphingobacterium griseoflavum TaxID=1474952 RepID=A0ABQ3HXI7_9SPHI|nr:hypothetical protein GCM10017764_16730 [Sphingobacterium griseoflavum]